MAIDNFPVIRKVNNPYELAPVVPLNIQKVDIAKPNVPLVQTAPIVYKAIKKKEEAPKQATVTPKTPSINRNDLVQAMVQKNPRLADAYSRGEVTDSDIIQASIQKYPKVKQSVLDWDVDLNTVDNVWVNPWPWLVEKWLWVVAWASKWALDYLNKADTAVKEVTSFWKYDASKDWRKQAYDKWSSAVFDKARENDTWSFDAWQVGGKTLASMALIPWLWPIKWAWIAKNVIVWGVEWAAATQANSFIDTGKAASLKDTAIWAIFGWATMWGLSKIQKSWLKNTLKTKLDDIASTGKWSITNSDLWWKGKWILKIIWERNTAWNKRIALGKKNIQEPSNMSKWWSWRWDVVQPSKKSIESAAEIIASIQKPSSNPVKLYNQVSDKITDLSQWLSGKLKTINIPYRTKYFSKTADDFKTFIDEWSDELGWGWTKRMNTILTKFKKWKDLDEVWTTAKELDDMIPDKIKRWEMLSAREELIRDARRKARESLNEFLEEQATSIGEEWVKKSFKTMSRLFHAKWQIVQNIDALTKKTTGLKQKLGKLAKYWAATYIGYEWLKALWIKAPSQWFTQDQ